MKIYLIRHAQSANNAVVTDDAVQFAGRLADPSITELGIEQARRVAVWLNENLEVDPEATGVVKLFCSPMQRSMETAWHIAQSLEFPVEVEVSKLLHEEGGLFTGRRKPHQHSPSLGRSRSPRTASRSPLSPRPRNDSTEEKSEARSSPLIASSAQNLAPPSPLLTGKSENNELIPGRTRQEIENDFPSLLLPPEVTASGWWSRPRETLEETAIRAHKLAEWLWAMAAAQAKEVDEAQSLERPRFTFPRACVIITHGMMQDTMMRVLMSPSCSSGFCCCVQDSHSETFQFPEPFNPAKRRLSVKRTLAANASSQAPPSTPSPDVVPEGEKYNHPVRNMYMLASNVGISILDLYVASALPDEQHKQCDEGNVKRSVAVLCWNKVDFLPLGMRTGHALGPFVL